MNNLEFYKDEIINSSITEVFIKYTGRVQHSNRECIGWLCKEHQILDKEEKKYLSNVIRPFANRMVSITKIKDWIDEDSNFEVLEIALRLPCKIRDMEFVHLPYFEKDTMYKGMELDKEYTLKELGL